MKEQLYWVSGPLIPNAANSHQENRKKSMVLSMEISDHANLCIYCIVTVNLDTPMRCVGYYLARNRPFLSILFQPCRCLTSQSG
jgi:hypothetical protein